MMMQTGEPFKESQVCTMKFNNARFLQLGSDLPLFGHSQSAAMMPSVDLESPEPVGSTAQFRNAASPGPTFFSR
jgi:hypothetical protein